MRKSAFCICKNKGADQVRSNCAADQHLCFRYIDSTIPLLPRNDITTLAFLGTVVKPSYSFQWGKGKGFTFLSFNVLLDILK